MEMFSILLGIAGFVVGIVSVRISMVYNRRAKYAERARTFYDWPLLQTAARELARRIQAERKFTGWSAHGGNSYADRIVVGIHGGGTIFAQLVIFELDERIPLRTVYVLPRGSPFPTDLRLTHDAKETTKFNILIPKELHSFPSRQFVIVDDCATTGHSLSETVAALREMKIESIHTAAAVCCTSAINAKNAPTFYWATSETDDVYFPWGSGKRLQRYVDQAKPPDDDDSKRPEGIRV